MITKAKKEFNRPIPPKQGENLLPYYHCLHRARMKADLPGRILIRKETKRVGAKILFEESLA